MTVGCHPSNKVKRERERERESDDAVAEGESDDEGALDSLDDESQLLYELLRVAQQSAHSDCMY